MHDDREQRDFLGVGTFSSSLFWFLWLLGSMLLDENWTSWAVSESFSDVMCQEATEYKLKQALVGANQLSRLMIPVRRCEIIYPPNTQAWQVSVFWVTDLMSTVCFWLSVLHCNGRTWTVWSVKSSVIQQRGLEYNVAWGDLTPVFSPPQTKKD